MDARGGVGRLRLRVLELRSRIRSHVALAIPRASDGRATGERTSHAGNRRLLACAAAERRVPAAARCAHEAPGRAAAASARTGCGPRRAVRGVGRRRQGKPHLRSHVPPRRARHERARHREPRRGGRARLRGVRVRRHRLLSCHAAVLAGARHARHHHVLRSRLVHRRHPAHALRRIRRSRVGRSQRRGGREREGEGEADGRGHRRGARRAPHRLAAPRARPTSSGSSSTTAIS